MLQHCKGLIELVYKYSLQFDTVWHVTGGLWRVILTPKGFQGKKSDCGLLYKIDPPKIYQYL